MFPPPRRQQLVVPLPYTITARVIPLDGFLGVDLPTWHRQLAVGLEHRKLLSGVISLRRTLKISGVDVDYLHLNV